MQRQFSAPRPNAGKKLEAIGLSFHAWDDYWKEDACYVFTAAEVDVLEEATETLHTMCLAAAKHVVEHNRFAELAIPSAFWGAIRRSIERDEFTLYGRFDLAYDGKSPPKMLEYNADTPTSLLESAVAQWYWLEDVYPKEDQFNSLHEKLVERWKLLAPLVPGALYFASLANNEEDWVCTAYLMDTATQAGLEARHVDIEQLGFDSNNNIFVDADGLPIQTLFKLYPWEWMMREQFGPMVPDAQTRFIEPLWKSLLSCKGILAILWELYPDHPNLLPAFLDSHGMTSYVRKPLYSREGANVEVVVDGTITHAGEGRYGEEGYVYQALYNMPSFSGRYPVIGSWIVGSAAAGMCIREDDGLVTTNMSNIVPHYFR